MKTKLKIFEILVIFIAILFLMNAVSASSDVIDDTMEISESEPVESLNIDENNTDLEIASANTEESSQNQIISQSSGDNLGDTQKDTAKKEGVITSNDLKTYYHSGKTLTTTITEKTTGKGIITILKVTYIKNGKTINTESYHTGSDGVAYITPELPVGEYSIKISPDDDNVIAKTVNQTVTIKKATTKVTVKQLTAKKIKGKKGYTVTLKAVLSNTKNKAKINEGKVKFEINGKTYLVKVKKGVATKKVKLTKTKIYKYTAQFMGNSNIKKSNIASGKVITKVYDTKITVKNIKGFFGDKKKYQIKVTTSSGKKVTSGQLKITWNGKTILCNVTNGVVKLVGTFGGNFKEEIKGDQYFYKTSVTKYKVKYIPTSLKYKGSSANYNIVSTYKCDSCGKTTTHTHQTNETTTKIYVI